VHATAITFDVTGTLIHSPRLAEIYREVLERHGIPAPAADLARLVPLVWQEMACSAEMAADRFTAHPEGARGWWQRFVERIGEHLGGPVPSPFAAAELFARFGRAEAWEVYPEVPAVLADLHRRGFRLGVVSNWDGRLPGLLAALGLERHLDAVVHSAAVGVEKPHPRIFRAVCGELEVDPQEALHVGDRVREDVEGAVAAGMEALLLVRRRAGAGGPPAGDLSDLTPLPEIVVPPGGARGRGGRRGHRR
jgi:putative hydrolase of the HAD superfamily